MLRSCLCEYGVVRENESMKKHTTFGIGGPVTLLIEPFSALCIPHILKICAQAGKKVIVIGNGSNLLFSDEQMDLIIVKNNFRNISISETKMTVSSGTPMTLCAVEAEKKGLKGLSFAYGIPGTIGGGVYMNAGAYGGELSQIVTKTTCCDRSGEIYEFFGTAHEFGYRTSVFKRRKDLCILSVEMDLSYGVREEIRAEMDDLLFRRRDKQPLEYPNAGSVFKRPEGMFAGKLIEDCGLKGFSIGDAQVSTKHAGFIVNKGCASAFDVKRLIEYIQKTVFEKFNVALECEIEVVE